MVSKVKCASENGVAYVISLLAVQHVHRPIRVQVTDGGGTEKLSASITYVRLHMYAC